MKATNCLVLLAFLMFARDGLVVNAQGAMLKCISQVQLQKMAISCLREFYLSFRTNPNADCPTSFRSKFPRCLNHTLLNCFTANGLPPLPPAMNPVAAFGNLNDTTAFCEYVAPVQVQPFMTCSQNYYQALGMCVIPFKQMFDANKGDPELCRAYSEELNCIMEAGKTNCNPEEIANFTAKYPFLSEKQYNPFCSDKQVYGSSTTLSSTTFLLLASLFILASVAVM